MSIDYEKDLNAEQYRVVTAEGGPILVIAGAGSGKTRTLTYRVTRLIDTGTPPERILLATFTNKAAREMLGRVELLSGVDVRRLWGGTFHAIANRVLRRHGHLLGYGRNYSIMDTDDTKSLLNACIGDAGIDTKASRFPRGDVIGDIIGYSVNTVAPLEETIGRKYPYFSALAEDIVAIAAAYRKRKQSLNLMDFDDLLANWLDLLRNEPEVLREYAERFLHVLVDEYQDTNSLQAAILDLLGSRHRNLMVVGDDHQSIYSFRGANFENILRFPDRYPDVKLFKLETNYRSTPQILDLANRSIVRNRDQFQKELRAVRKSGFKPVYIPVRNVALQAAFVARRITDLIMEGIPIREIAVLYRAHYHAMELQLELTRRGIPFEIRSGIRFFEMSHVKDITSYLRVLVNPLDEAAWKRVLGLYEKVGKVTADRVWKALAAEKDPLAAIRDPSWVKRVGKAAAPGLLRLGETMALLCETIKEQAPADLIHLLLNRGYREDLRERFTDSFSREEDLVQLANFSSRFTSLTDFISELSLLTNTTEGEDSYAVEEKDRVILSSIHQAKGLEWSIVFIIWCAEGMIPLARALNEAGGEEEERRLFYVATTRAKDQLYLCHPLIDYSRGMGMVPLRPSRFIEELEQDTSHPTELPYEQWLIDED
ncbi:MAG TPA: ATP-dependent helicase [Syntrophales bacterium]|nr:ATP-dependent helicase [Syntrophales bacterium]